MKHLIVYCSPNGSTRHVAEVMAKRLSESGRVEAVLDLGTGNSDQELPTAFRNPNQETCLWIGSPVYVDHPVPPIETFISSLPPSYGCCAVPFVTWGGVTSGTALYEMAQGLIQKGCVLIGAAKVIAVHSSLWRMSHPLGDGHPDEADDRVVLKLVDRVESKLSCPPPQWLSIEVLDYQPQVLKEEARRSSIASAKQALPELRVAVDKCVQCGECAEKCPAKAITLDPFPQVGKDCFICLKCVRECPEEAFPFDTHAIEERLRGMAARINERPFTQTFY
ncbi:MAG: 4Fe-4S binding protein [Desulfobacterales bacterium]